MSGTASSSIYADNVSKSIPDIDQSPTPPDVIRMRILSPPMLQDTGEDIHLLKPSGDRSAAEPSREASVCAQESTRQTTLITWASAFQSWWQESALSAVALAFLVAIVSILSIFGGRPLPKLGHGLNLNTLIALLATFLRSSLIMVVEEVLGQAKWIWQRQPHPMVDLASFDNASRGPLGSLLLHLRIAASGGRSFITRHSISAILSSIVTVSSLAVGSFIQQAIKSVPCQIALPHSKVSIPLAYGEQNAVIMRYGAGLYDTEASIKGNIFRALTESSSGRSTLIQGCLTGNCTFPEVAPGVTHITGGFCNKCLDTAPSVVQVTDFYFRSNYTFEYLRSPNNLQVGPIGVPYADRLIHVGYGNNTGLESYIKSHTEYSDIWNVSAARVDVLALSTAGCEWSSFDKPTKGSYQKVEYYDCHYPQERSLTEDGRWNVVSASCALYPCIKGLRAEVSNGRFNEVVVSEDAIKNYDYSGTGGPYGMIKTPCFIHGIRYDEHNISLAPSPRISFDYWGGNGTSAPTKCFYSVPMGVARSLNQQGWFQSLVNGTCGMATNQGNNPKTRSFTLCGSDDSSADSWWLAGLYHRGNATFETISTTMDNVAEALTDSLRLGSIAEYGLNINNTVNGTVWQSAVCTEFNWLWLLFPAVLIALTIISLGLMIASTASGGEQTPIWKSSILPFFYLSNASARAELHPLSLEGMKRAAKREHVELKRDDQHRWQLVRAQREEESNSGSRMSGH